MSYNPNKLRRAVLKEELVALTGNPRNAMILSQLIYWSERIYDFDKFINEETKRSEAEGIDRNISPSNGWFYKTIDELVEELMGLVARDKVMEVLNEFVDIGFISKRRNPEYKWDRTNQYRVNIAFIQQRLFKIGYTLEGYRFDVSGLVEADGDSPKNLISEIDPSIVDKSTIHVGNSTIKSQKTRLLKVENPTSNTKDYNKDYYKDYTTTKVEIPETKKAANVVVENEKDKDVLVSAINQSDSVAMDELIKQIQDATGVECVHLPGLESVLSMPDGIDRLQRAIVNYPDLAGRITSVNNPVGFLRFIAQHNIKPPLNDKRTGKCSLVKQTDFNNFLQHQYTDEELNKLFEPIDSG